MIHISDDIYFSRYLHILVTIFSERGNSSAEKIVPRKKHHKNVNFCPISKKFIPIKFEIKFEREHTSNFCILWADCERQSRGKSKWSRKTCHNVSGIPLTMWGTNLNEDPYWGSHFKRVTLLSYRKIKSDSANVITALTNSVSTRWCKWCCWCLHCSQDFYHLEKAISLASGGP